MTMPALNYIEHECTMQCDPDCNTQGASYIRADISEELARALEHMVMQFQHPDQMADDALARFRAITH